MKDERNTVYQRLQRVQQKLEVPKTLWNDFSKFNYRSAEGILKAVKPLLAEEGLALFMRDEVVNVGAFNYVKSTAMLVVETEGLSPAIDAHIEVSAFAREPLEKKGMDASQISGASSSYARKYALCGLFAIDDGIDNDALPPSSKGKQYSNKTAPAQNQNAGGEVKQGGYKVDFKVVRKQIDDAKSVDELTVIWTMLADPKTKKVPDYVEKYLKEHFTKKKEELMKGETQNADESKVVTANN